MTVLPSSRPGSLLAQRWATPVSHGVIAALLLVALVCHLLAALLAGLAVHQTVLWAARHVERRTGQPAHGWVVAALSVLIVAALVGAGLGVYAFFQGQASHWPELVAKLDEVLVSVRTQLPASVAHYLPQDSQALQMLLRTQAHDHAEALQGAGKAALTSMVHVLLGLVLGAMVALSHTQGTSGPLAQALSVRAARLAQVFGQIVSAQAKIAALNTALTAGFLWVVLPLMGAHLPLTKTIVVATFLLGLLPVIGNLASNTLVVLVALSVAPWVALVALVFLIVIHKLEYFLNARIVGGEIQAQSWEILLAMLVMEALFGLPGVVAAPIFYAYLKQELMASGWV